jgi:hypothetical protein
MIKRNRLVALFDILGFGSRLKHEKLADLRRLLRSFIRTIRSEAITSTATNLTAEDDDNLESARFVFDSVVLISHDITASQNTQKFIYACIQLLEFGFIYNLPFRGSITLGDVFTDEETGLVLSDQFPELRDAEQMQQWMGCFIHSRATEALAEGIFDASGPEALKHSPLASHVLHWFEVPIKEAFRQFRPLHAWCLNWVQMIDHQAIEPGLKYLRNDNEKALNTEAFVEHILALDRRFSLLGGNGVPEGAMMKMLQSKGAFRAKCIDQGGNGIPVEGTFQYTLISSDGAEGETGTYKPS